MPALASSHLVECYWPDITDGKLHTAADRLEAATRAHRAAGSTLSYLGALLMPDDETVFFLFDGAQDDIRAVSAEAQVPFERIAATRWVSNAAVEGIPPVTSLSRLPEERTNCTGGAHDRH